MKNLATIFLSFLTFFASAQIPALNDIVRTTSLTPAKVSNALDASKSFTASGTDSYTISTGFNPYMGSATYAVGDMFKITFTNSNTSGTVTVNIDTEGAIAIKDDSGADLAVGALKAGGTYSFRYNGTHFRMVGSSGGGGGGSGTVTNVTGASPIVITGTSTVTPNVTINNADDDGATKGAAAFTNADFDATAGVVSLASDVLRNGGALGTPSSGSAENLTGLPGTSVINTPAGNISATTVQGAIDELEGEKISSVTGDGVDNTDPLNPVMDLSAYAPKDKTFSFESDNYTFQASDFVSGNHEVVYTGTSDKVFTLPLNSSVPVPAGRIVWFSRSGVCDHCLSIDGAVGTNIVYTKGDIEDSGRGTLMAAEKLSTGVNDWKVYNGLSFSLSAGDVTGALTYTPVPPTRTIAGVDLADNITQDEAITALDGWHRVTISSDVVFASTSYADVTGLLFPVTANVRSEFRGWLYVDAANTSEGWTTSLTGPTLTSCRYLHSGFNATNTIVTHISTSYDETSALLSASTTNSMGELAGRIITSASGNIQLRVKTETGGINITVKAGSYIEYRVVGVNN